MISIIHMIWDSFSIWPVFAYAEFKQGWWVVFLFILTIVWISRILILFKQNAKLWDDFDIFYIFQNLQTVFFYQDTNSTLLSIWDLFDIFDTSPFSSYSTPTPKKVKLRNDVGVEELIQYVLPLNFVSFNHFPLFLTRHKMTK